MIAVKMVFVRFLDSFWERRDGQSTNLAKGSCPLSPSPVDTFLADQSSFHPFIGLCMIRASVAYDSSMMMRCDQRFYGFDVTTHRARRIAALIAIGAVNA